MGKNDVIVLVDFAENYKFLVQDEIQGYHWNKTQCTLNSVVVYSKKDGVLVVRSLCFISDDLNHDVDMVYKILKETVSYILEHVNEECKLVHYYSDGCAGQYKNYKNFLNLCCHKEDFGIDCKWNFFATSHGKSPCDGVGGTVKRLAARASLQRPYDKQLLSAQEVFTFYKEEIKGIEFIFISQADMEITRMTLEPCYTNAKTVPGTCSIHHFVPLSASCIGTLKRISMDQNYALQFNFLSTPASEPIVLSVNSFVDNDQRDAKIRFMHPKCIARSYFWPVKDDTCWVPDENIICNIGVPTTVTGRQYKLQPKGQEVLCAFMDKQ